MVYCGTRGSFYPRKGRLSTLIAQQQGTQEAGKKGQLQARAGETSTCGNGGPCGAELDSPGRTRPFRPAQGEVLLLCALCHLRWHRPLLSLMGVLLFLKSSTFQKHISKYRRSTVGPNSPRLEGSGGWM